MNARVFLLVLVSALFMGAWNGDQKTMQAAIARREQLREEAWAEVMQTRVTQESRSVIPVAMTVAQKIEPEVEAKPDDASDVPLPSGIAPGQYRAVSQSGDTKEITVSSNAGEGNVGRDFYMVDAQDGDRWYLIRIQ